MSSKNRIRFARSITRNNLPATLDYGEPGYVKNDRLIIGNEDGTEFIVNDWNSLKNKPDLAGLETTVAFTADETIQAYRVVRIKPSNGRVVRASRASLSVARVVGIVTAETNNQSTALVQSSGVVGNPAWSWTPGDYIYLSNTVGDLTDDISGFSDTDAICLIGIAISATELLLAIEPPQLAHENAEFPIVQTVTDGDTSHVPSSDAIHKHVSGAITAIDLTEDLQNLEIRVEDTEEDITNLSTDVSSLLIDVQDLKDPFIESAEDDIDESFNLIAIANAQALRCDISIVGPSAVRFESVYAARLGSTVVANSVIHNTIGDSTGITPNISIDQNNFLLSFTITSGTWSVVVRVFPMPVWGGTLPSIVS
jgi:hypothetical protein